MWDEKQDGLWKEHLSLRNAVYNVEGPNKHPHQLQMIYFQNIQFDAHLHHLRLKQHPKQFPQKPITHSKTHSLLYNSPIYSLIKYFGKMLCQYLLFKMNILFNNITIFQYAYKNEWWLLLDY